MLARLFLMYALIPSAAAIFVLLVGRVEPVTVSVVFLLPALWLAAYVEKKRDPHQRLDQFILVFLVSASGIIFVYFRSLMTSHDGVPLLLFDLGFGLVEYLLVTLYAGYEHRQISGTTRFGMSALLYGWSNICAVPLVVVGEIQQIQLPDLPPSRLVPISTSITCFLIGFIFLMVECLTSRKNTPV